jgi:hypothetical protein
MTIRTEPETPVTSIVLAADEHHLPYVPVKSRGVVYDVVA